MDAQVRMMFNRYSMQWGIIAREVERKTSTRILNGNQSRRWKNDSVRKTRAPSHESGHQLTRGDWRFWSLIRVRASGIVTKT